MSKQIVGRSLWERCHLCGCLNNSKAKRLSQCLSKEECKAVTVGGDSPPNQEHQSQQNNPSETDE